MNETGPAERGPAEVAPAARHRQRLAVLGALGQELAHPRDLDHLFRTVYQAATRVLDTTGFLLGLYDAASQTVEIVRQMDSGAELPGGSFPLGAGFTSQVIRTRQPRLIRRWSVEEPPVQVQYATDRRGLPESGLTVPLLAGEAVLGVLSVQSYRPDAYDEDDLLTLQVVAGQTAAAVAALRRSERLDAQLERRVSELETILASMADALVIVDAAGGIVRLNEAARRLLGPELPGVILGQPLDRERWGQWPLGGRAVAEALRPMIEALRCGEMLHEVEVEVEVEATGAAERAGTGRRVLSFSGAPLPASGPAAGGVIVFRDVTVHRDVERLKDEVLSIASHDLRTPLTVIRGFAELLRVQTASGQATEAALARGLSRIEDQATRLEEWLHLLLDLTRMKGGRVVIDPRPTDLVALAGEAVAAARATAPDHRLVLEAPACLIGVWDGLRLRQVLQNLLTNAVKYSPQGGTIEVTIAADRQEGDPERQAFIRVRDEGVGLPPEDLARVFERFYRASGIRQLEGSGLGLYICQGIVTAHGGRIWAESPGPGRGSTFCVRLPVGDAG